MSPEALERLAAALRATDLRMEVPSAPEAASGSGADVGGAVGTSVADGVDVGWAVAAGDAEGEGRVPRPADGVGSKLTQPHSEK